MLDYELPRAPMIPSKLLIEDCRVSSLRSFRKYPTSYLHETNPTYYGAHARGFIIKDRKDKTLEDENMKVDVQVIEYPQLPNIRSNDVKNNFLDSINQEVISCGLQVICK